MNGNKIKHLFVVVATLVVFNGCSAVILPQNQEPRSIHITPNTASINVSSSVQFSATGVYSDGTSKDITHLVLWYSESSNIATINALGLATGNNKGNTSIKAKIGTVIGTANLSVTKVSVSSWTKVAGITDSEAGANDVIIDSNGNSYVTGYTTGNLYGEAVTGKKDAFLVKYNLNGEIIWTRLAGIINIETESYGVALDSNENIYITGYTHGSLHGEPIIGSKDVFIIKYNSSGNRIWTIQFGAVGASSEGRGIRVDNVGNIYVSGNTNGELNGETLNGIQDAFIVKYDSNHNLEWTKLTGGFAGTTGSMDIATDLYGNSYIAGYTFTGINGETLTGFRDTFIIKYDTNGATEWTRLSGTIDSDTYGTSVDLDSYGNIYIAGDTDGNLDDQVLTGPYDVFVIKYDVTGNKKWTSLSGAESALSISKKIAVDSQGNSYVTGYTKGNLNNEIKSGISDVYVIKHSTNGAKAWTKLLGTSGVETIGNGLALDPSNKVCSVGFTNGELDGEPAVTGHRNLFVTTKLNE